MRPRSPITDRKIKVALVGCGRISASHFKSIEYHKEFVELVGVADSNPEALKVAMDVTKVQGYHSLTSLLSECSADLIILCTPSGLHAREAIMCAAAGRHVMTEKPMATNWADAKAMVRAFDNAGLRLFVVKQNRHNPTLRLLKGAIEQGRFGRLYMVNVNVFWTRPQEYYDSAKWRGTWEFDGGALMNQASHYVDLLNWLVGPIESVQAYTSTLARNIEVEDTGVVSIKWRNGALGSLNVTMLTYPKNFEGSITILGEKGTVRLGGVAANEIKHWEFDAPHEDDKLVNSSTYQTTSVYGHGHINYYKNVIDTLRGEAEPLTDGREGLQSLETLIATYISARKGKKISLPLEALMTTFISEGDGLHFDLPTDLSH